MLGLTINPLRRKSRKSLRSIASRESTSDLDLPDADSMISQRTSQPATPVKGSVAVDVAEIRTNGNDSPAPNTKATPPSLHRSHSSQSFRIVRVVEVSRTIRKRCRHDLDVEEHFFEGFNLNKYLDFISEERLLHMPRKGSEWDRVLKAAEFFGLQVSQFGETVSKFVLDSKSASNTALAGCYLLLELGHGQGRALERTFTALFELGHLISQITRSSRLFDSNETIKESLGELYSDLVSLVGNVAITYRQRINSLSPTSSVTIDFNKEFGRAVDHIWLHRERLIEQMWNLQLRQKVCRVDLQYIRNKLSPAEHNVKLLLSSRLSDKADRAVGTCDWIQSDLLDFLRSSDKVLTITGQPGCGKSMLAAWMKERLQRPLGRKSYDTLSYAFASDAPVELTTLVLLKSLLTQLLERNVGDIRLLEKLAKAFEEAPDLKDAANLQDSLWKALHAGLQTVDNEGADMIIFVDGGDVLSNGDKAAEKKSADIIRKLRSQTQELAHVRVVSLSETITLDKEAHCRNLQIKSDTVHDDITTYLRQTLSSNSHFNELKDGDRAKFVDGLVHKADGSFLWARLAASILVKETSCDHLKKTNESFHSGIDKIMEKVVGTIDLKNSVTKHLLAFLLAAQRPLTVGEMTDLLQIDLDHRTLNTGLNLRQHIATTCSSLVVETKGFIRLRHSLIRRHLRAVCGSRLPSAKDADRELTLRLLFYAKMCISVQQEPTFDVLSGNVLDETFQSHYLMEYVVRHWILHFRSSSLCGKNEELQLPAHFKDLLPDSVFFAMMEWSCWQSQFSVDKAIELHDLTLRIRSSCFGEKHQTVLQGLIIVGSLHRLTTNLEVAAGFFYRATVIGQAILYKFSSVVVACISVFLTCTETITVTKRTEIVAHRETMIKFIIEISKHKHGATSDIVIQWYEVLAKLYIAIKEEYRATVIYKELYEIIVIRFGKGSGRAREVSGALGDLEITLHGEGKKDVIEHYRWLLETWDEEDELDQHRISIIISLVLSYEASGEWFLAEKLLINLWIRISEICRLHATIELHILKIQVAVTYVKFLQRIKRVEEASNILICLWAEYEHHEFESELLIIKIKEIGVLFKSFGLLSFAISVFGKVWGWFKSKGKTEHEEACSTTILITEVVEEITETSTTTVTKTATTKTVTETITREIFETTYTRCKHTKADKQFFKACIALVKLYIAQCNWSEAEIIIRRSLELTWSAVLSFETKLTLTETHVSECIFIAMQLALVYHRQRHFEKAEAIYLRLYRACLMSLHIEHVCITEVSVALIHFYKEYHRHDKVIEIYIELLGIYRKQLGAAHKLTIKTLYALGSICLLTGRKEGYEYYIEIVTTLNKGKHCHHDAFEAATILCKYYYEERRWVELQKICVVLWETFTHHHHEYKFTAEFVQVLYERYVYVLEFHSKVEFSVIYKLTVEYRETVTKVFGISAAIVVTAMLALAAICEKHEKHYHESVTIYEEVIKKVTTTTTTTTVETETITKTVKKRLSKVYVQIITHGHSTSHTTIERGIAICLEVYMQLKIEFGCWHETTLTKLKELVLLYKKLNSHECHLTIIRLLQTSITEIITTVTVSTTLYTAARTLASIYNEVGMVSTGLDLLHQLHHLIILRDIGSTKDVTINIKLDRKVSKASFVFLVTFERCLHEKTSLSFTELMVDVLAETFFYEQYTQSLRKSVDIQVLLEHGAKLRHFWEVRNRHSLVAVLDAKLFAEFKAKYSGYIKTKDEFTRVFYVVLLSELGTSRSSIDFPLMVCRSTNAKVRALIDAGEFFRAQEVARCAFDFIGPQHFYHEGRCLSYGYKLAELLAGIDVKKTTDTKLQESMLEVSRQVLRDVLNALREANIDPVGLKFEDLNGLVRLLGSQKNYGELVFLLQQLWQSREVQKTWSSATVLSIGRSLVHAYAGNCEVPKAIDLCDRICYNLRRSRGWLDRETLAMTELLTQLYTKQHRHSDVMRVHEEVLREVDEHDNDAHVNTANEHFKLLKAAFHRMGSFHKPERNYQDLYARLNRYKGLNVHPVGEWKGKAESQDGQYVPPTEWKLVRGDSLTIKKGDQHQIDVLRAASDRWGCFRPQMASH